MEDISRNLEREIARAKPKLPKRSKKQRILILYPEGKIKSGWYLRFFNRLLLMLVVISLIAGLALYYMYNTLQEKNLQIVQELDNLGTTYQDLLHERETLMARLVLIKKDNSRIVSKPDPAPVLPKKEEAVNTRDTLPESGQTAEKKTEELTPETKALSSEIVSVQKFSIKKRPDQGTISIKFHIRNISKNGDDISGRIFAVLKPREGVQKDWVILPRGSLKEGMPEIPEKGQTFSISRFKPVTFTFKTDHEIEFFREAVIFVFDSDKKLISTSIFPIDQSTVNDE